MLFWEGGIGKLEARFRLFILDTFSLRRTFQSVVSHPVLCYVLLLKQVTRCIKLEARF